MKKIFLTTAAALACISFAPEKAVAKQKPCPPGLAKKNPPCVPPGLAKKGVAPGDYYFNHPHAWIDPDKYELDSKYGWYKIGDNIVVRTNRETGEILELMDALIAVLD